MPPEDEHLEWGAFTLWVTTHSYEPTPGIPLLNGSRGITLCDKTNNYPGWGNCSVGWVSTCHGIVWVWIRISRMHLMLTAVTHSSNPVLLWREGRRIQENPKRPDTWGCPLTSTFMSSHVHIHVDTCKMHMHALHTLYIQKEKKANTLYIQKEKKA